MTPTVDSTSDDAFDRRRRRVLWSMPTGLYVVTSGSGSRFNGMTLNLAMQVSVQPKRLGIAVLKDALTHSLIDEGQAFVLHILAREQRNLVRHFVKPSKHDPDEKLLAGHPYVLGDLGVPILTEAPAHLGCRLWQAIDCGDHSLFIGDVVDVSEDGTQAEVLRMQDTRMNYGG